MPKSSPHKLGLIGKDIEYSFSPDYFDALFHHLNIVDEYTYEKWSMDTPEDVISFLQTRPFYGCNVTIPYKKLAAQQCDVLIGFAAEIQAVNTIITVRDKLIGYNTDVYAVMKSITQIFQLKSIAACRELNKSVLVFGTGGASAAVQAAVRSLGWVVQVVSRSAGADCISYKELKASINLAQFDILVNTTPLGLPAYIDEMVDINVDQITSNHVVFDLIYNPQKTLLLKRSETQGARFMNGQYMLEQQADLAWEIWKN